MANFYDATYRGQVNLQTKKGTNYYFTPLGKSYICVEDEDPLGKTTAVDRHRNG